MSASKSSDEGLERLITVSKPEGRMISLGAESQWAPDYRLEGLIGSRGGIISIRALILEQGNLMANVEGLRLIRAESRTWAKYLDGAG